MEYHTRTPHGIHAITRALTSIQPGEEVRYGSRGDGHAVGLGNEEYYTVLKLVEELETKGRIMRFHRYGYYVAHGVTPQTKAKIEGWAKIIPLPRQL